MKKRARRRTIGKRERERSLVELAIEHNKEILAEFRAMVTREGFALRAAVEAIAQPNHRFCTVMIVCEFLANPPETGAPAEWEAGIMARSIGYAPGAEYEISFDPQRTMREGAWVVGLNGALLLQVQVGDEVIPMLSPTFEGPIVRIPRVVRPGTRIFTRSTLGVRR